MEARRQRRLAARLVVVALLGLCVVQADRDVGRLDGAARITTERRAGQDVAVAPAKGDRLDQDRAREVTRGEVAPSSVGPAAPARPAGGSGRGAVDAPGARWSEPIAVGSADPRAPPTS